MLHDGWVEKLKQVWSEPWYPLLFAVYPVLFYYAHNITDLEIFVLTVPLLVTVVVSIGLLLIAKVVCRSWYAAAIFVGIVVLAFFSHGQLASMLPDSDITLASFVLGGDEAVVIGWVIVVGLTGWLLYRNGPGWTSRLAKFLNTISVVLVGLTLLTIVPTEMQRIATGYYGTAVQASDQQQFNDRSQDAISKLGYLPDVYYLVFDKYAGEKTLKDYYGYNNLPFLANLEKEGFYVAHDSYTNYPWTHYSLSSVFSMDYHKGYYGQGAPDREVTNILGELQNPEVSKVFKSMGYNVYQLASWYIHTRKNSIADQIYLPNKYDSVIKGLDIFESRLLATTLFDPLVKKVFAVGMPDTGLDYERWSNYYQQNMFPEIVDKPGPKFVFVHTILPHPGYVFNADCSPHSGSGPYEIDAYLNQLQCTNTIIQKYVDKILSSSEHNPIIVVAADEGAPPMKNKMPAGDVTFKDASLGAIVERTNILNTFYFPDGDYSKLDQYTSPVNTFRIIFSQYFGMDYDTLPDKTFVFPTEKKPYGYIDVTNRVRPL